MENIFKMWNLKMFFILIVVLVCVTRGVLAKDIPEYIEICKRDQNTIDECVTNSIEKLKPKLAEGIPELNVPSIEPFIIPKLVVDRGNLVQFKAVGRDVKVYGASNFTIKTIAVDLDSLTIRARVRFPQLHFDGKYQLDARLLVLPLHGQGDIIANASRCDAEITLRGQFVEREGVEYVRFTALDMDIVVRDYRMRLNGLFNGQQALGDVANEAINQNRGEFLRASKPYVERTASRLLLDAANGVASTFPIEQLLPMP